MTYTLKIATNGREMYYEGNKLCKKTSIPDVVMRNLKPNEPYEYERQEVKVNPKTCVICEEPGNFEKFLFLQTVYICSEHVYSTTTGQIAHAMHEKGLVNATQT